MRTLNRLTRRILDDHRLLTAVACINLAGVAAASVLDLSDRTFYVFLIAAVASGWLALRVEYRDNPTDTTGETR